MAKNVKIGDRVKLKAAGITRFGNQSNGATGTVTGEKDSDGWHWVKWDGGSGNNYKPEHLKRVEKTPKENLLSEVHYTDVCSDTLEVDTSMRAQVYIGAGELDSDGDFDSEKTVELNVADVKKLRKQLKAWLDKHHPAA